MFQDVNHLGDCPDHSRLQSSRLVQELQPGTLVMAEWAPDEWLCASQFPPFASSP